MTSRSLSSLVVSWALIACSAGSSTPAPAASATSGCRPADNFFVQARLDYFRALLTSTDSARAVLRDSLGLSAVSVNKVTFVTKQTTCVSAANALNTFLEEPGTNRLVWVYALGGDYAVIDPDMEVPSGEDMPIYIFSRQWNYKSTLMGI